MINFLTDNTALDNLITTIGENTFIDSLLARLDKEQAEAILVDVAVEHGLDVAVKGGA